jgi:hypothetical protein
MSTVNDAPLIIDNIRPGGTRPSEGASRAKPEEEASFWDFLDVINPLQHIPIVSTLYREITGDTIKPISRLAGGALFGGVIGAGLAAVSTVAEGMMGLDEGETMLSFLFGGDEENRPAVAAGPQVAKQALGAAPEGQESPTQMIARYAQPIEQMAQTATPAASVARSAMDAGVMMPSSAAPFLMQQDAAAPAPTAETTTTAFAALRQRVETASAPSVAPPSGVMPATAASLKAPETADRSKESPAPVPDAVQRALEAQGLGADAASHPMIQALAAGKRPTQAASTLPATSGMAAAAPSAQAPQQMPGWFDQAMSQALDRYEQTGRLNAAARPSGSAHI